MRALFFFFNISKSHLEPHQIADWLEFIIDLYAGCFRVPSDKIDRLKTAISKQGNRVTAHFLAGVVSRIISMSLARGPVSCLHTKVLYAILNHRRCWGDWLSLTMDALEKLHYLEANISMGSQSGATRVFFSDSSSAGYGGGGILWS